MMVSWNTIKEFTISRDLSIQYIDQDNNYYLRALDGAFDLDCILNKDQNTEEIADFEANFKPNGNQRIGPMHNNEHSILVDVGLRKGAPGTDSLTICTHDFTDRTCWYQNAVQVTGETLVDSGDGLTFQATSGKQHWININSERLTFDYKRLIMRDGSLGDESVYFVVIYIDSVVADPSTYTVNFDAGSVTFISSQTGKTITADFFHNDGISNRSDFVICPPAGKILRIEHVEIQFSKTLTFPNPVHFETWAGGTLTDYADFNQGLYDAGYGQGRSLYRNHRDLINWCNNQYPLIPACGTMVDDILVFPFLFLVAADLRSDQGAVLRTGLKSDLPLVGEIGTATLYCEVLPI